MTNKKKRGGLDRRLRLGNGRERVQPRNCEQCRCDMVQAQRPPPTFTTTIFLALGCAGIASSRVSRVRCSVRIVRSRLGHIEIEKRYALFCFMSPGCHHGHDTVLKVVN